MYRRKTGLYEKGNYPKHRDKLSEIDWNLIIAPANPIDVNVQNLTLKVIEKHQPEFQIVINIRQGDRIVHELPRK